MSDWIKRSKSLGAGAAKLIPVEAVTVAEWVRLKCQFGCGGYGECLTCPPYSLAPETTRKMLADYRRAVLIRMDRRGDADGEKESRRKMRDVIADLEREIFLAGYYRAFGMGAGPCSLCDPCDVSQPCQFPERARPSMEACGIDVFSTVRAAGWKIEVVKTEEAPYSLFGMVLIE